MDVLQNGTEVRSVLVPQCMLSGADDGGPVLRAPRSDLQPGRQAIRRA